MTQRAVTALLKPPPRSPTLGQVERPGRVSKCMSDPFEKELHMTLKDALRRTVELAVGGDEDDGKGGNPPTGDSDDGRDY